MKNTWLVGGLIFVVYVAALVGLTYYQSMPSQLERQAQAVAPKLINTRPISDELNQQLKERVRYGEWPLVLDEGRMTKHDPFRL